MLKRGFSALGKNISNSRSFSIHFQSLNKNSSFNEPFSSVNETVEDVHLNPTKHRQLLDAPHLGGEKDKLLKVCILGIPNAGKSTLVNQLLGSTVCPHSKKAHTTRFSSKAILTEKETQIIFYDTPGVVKPKDVRKFKLEQSLITNPVESARSADLILVLQGMSPILSNHSILVKNPLGFFQIFLLDTHEKQLTKAYKKSCVITP